MLLMLLSACQRPSPLVVLVSFDTTRADRVGAYGRDRAGTANLDALAAEGVLFEWALSQSSTTLASHTTVFSGLDSHGHAVVRNGYPPPAGLELLSERFAAEGWDTIGVVGASPLEDAMGLNRGFRVWEDHDLLPYLGQVEVGADQVNQRVFEILAETPRRPTLLFVHYYDNHMPWSSAPMDVAAEFVDPSYRGEVRRDLRGVMLLSDDDWIAKMSAEDRAHADNLYQAEISWTDRQFGELMAGLERRGRLKDALVVAFADHGESMNDTDWSWHVYGHGPDVDLDIIHVPLLMRGFGSLALPGGVRVERQVRLQDIGTTVLGVAGLGGTLGQGEDLAPLWSGAGGTTAPPSFAEATKPIPLESGSRWNNSPFERSVALDGKLLVTAPFMGTATLHDIAPGQPMRVEDPDEETLHGLIRAWDERAPPHRDPQMSAETEEALRRLGYVE